MITDGLPIATLASPSGSEVTEAQRIQAFQQAAVLLPPRIPVHTVLMPSAPGDPAAAGLYWELAIATGGRLTTIATVAREPRTHLAFVIDTSGSIRDPNTGGLWPIVINTLEAALTTEPLIAGVQILDGDGRFILGRNGNGADAWFSNTPETRERIQRVMRRYDQDTVSNPAPGIQNALRFLLDRTRSDIRMGIHVLGNEFNSSDRAGATLDRIDRWNPRDESGRRSVTISAIGFPTTIRYRFSMGNTGLRFANLMRQLAHEHDGAFMALPEL
jgi:hypothetical protein